MIETCCCLLPDLNLFLKDGNYFDSFSAVGNIPVSKDRLSKRVKILAKVLETQLNNCIGILRSPELLEWSISLSY